MQKHLKRAKESQYDEYYTLEKDVQKQIDAIPELLHYKWICPCDDENSAFVKTAQNKNIEIKYESKIDILTMPLYTNDDEIIITNPPFSILNKILRKLEQTNARFCILAPLGSMGYQIIIRNVRNGKWFINGKVQDFQTPFGPALVPCYWLSNIKEIRNPYQWSVNPPKQLADNGKIYNCNSMKDVSIATEKMQAVPVTYLYYHDPKVFEIIGRADNIEIRGREKFSRILIRKVYNEHY